MRVALQKSLMVREVRSAEMTKAGRFAREWWIVGHANAGAVRSEAAGSVSYQLDTSMRHIYRSTYI
jgi:hypothetical protein